MSKILRGNVIRKKVLAKVNGKIVELQEQYDDDCLIIDEKYRERRLALLEELSSLSSSVSSEKDSLADTLVDSILP